MVGKKGDEPAGLGVGDEMLMGGECFVDRFLPRCRILSIPRLWLVALAVSGCNEGMYGKGVSMRRRRKEERGGGGGEKKKKEKKKEMEQTKKCECTKSTSIDE